MKCPVHVALDMVPLNDVSPKFQVTADGEEMHRKRIILRCPLHPLCSRVAVEYDANRIEPILCRICKDMPVQGYGSLCRRCSSEYQKKMKERYPRKNYRVCPAEKRLPRLSTGPS